MVEKRVCGKEANAMDTQREERTFWSGGEKTLREIEQSRKGTNRRDDSTCVRAMFMSPRIYKCLYMYLLNQAHINELSAATYTHMRSRTAY